MTERATILIVEDDTDINEMLTALLEMKGYLVSRTYNGVEALAYLRSGADIPAVILLDLWMPVMDGLQFLNEYHQDPKLTLIPVIVFSAIADFPDAHSLDCAAVLRKPFHLEQLLHRIAQLTERK